MSSRRFPKNVDVLIIEDNQDVSVVLTEYLLESGISSEIVTNGKIARDLIGSKKYKFILLDIIIPGIKGTEIFEHIREKEINRNYDTEVCFISGNNNLENSYTQFHKPPKFMLKPLRLKELLNMIESEIK